MCPWRRAGPAAVRRRGAANLSSQSARRLTRRRTSHAARGIPRIRRRPRGRASVHEGTLGHDVAWEYGDTAVGFDVGADLIIETVDASADGEDRALVGRFVGCSL